MSAVRVGAHTSKTALALAWFVALLLAPHPAEAHARLVATLPAANATLASSPGEIAVTFNEPVTIESTHALVIMRTDGTAVPCAGDPRRDIANPARVVCRPAAPLKRGAYTTFWLATSKDAHVVHGAFAFGVGVVVRDAVPAVNYPYDPSGLLAGIFRWLSLFGAALIVGTLAFEAVVLRPFAFDEDARPAVASLSRSRAALGRAGICIAAFGSIGILDVQAAAATGLDAFAAVLSLKPVILSTWGLAWLARMFSLAGIALLTWRGKPSAVSLGLSALFVLAFAQSGHAIANKAMLAADWVHLACAAIWFGGLATFAAGLPRAMTSIEPYARPAFIKTVISRFSAVALPAVAALIATGIFGSIAHFVTVPALKATAYGRVVLAKAALLLPLLALGFYHYRAGRRASSRAFAVTLACEAAILIAIVGLSAVLTGLPPPPPPGSDHG
jgi:copper transport protein